jgi:hypothetical protein
MVPKIFKKAVDATPTVAAGFLRPIDTKRIAEEFDLERVAAENGAKNVPPTDSVNLDSVEQKIVQRIESEWTWHGGELVQHLRAYANRLIGFSIDAEFQRLQLKAMDALTRLRSAHHRAESELGYLKKTYMEVRAEFERFRKKHRLERPVRAPAGRWTSFGLLFVLIALESVLNGFFFAKGSEFGLVGGIGTAIGISVCNVAFAFVIGLGPFRWVHHHNFAVKFAGLILSIGGVGALIALHTFAAHLRDSTAAVGEERAMAMAIESMLRAPWHVANHLSAYLFALGLVFGLTSLWKGYAFDDPYPSYGRHARREEFARSIYSEEHAAVFDELDAIKEETVRELDSGISRIPRLPQEAAQIRAHRAAMLQTFRAYEVAVATAANQLLTLYRDKNRECRTTEAPRHFAEKWHLPHSFLESGEVRQLTAEPESPAPDIPATLAELRAFAKSLLEEYEGLLTKYPHAAQMY